jgi:hypothetical protein
VGDDGVDLLGLSFGEGQRADGTAARSQDDGWARVEVGDEPGQVIGAQLRGGVLAGVVELTAVDAPWVGGEHGVVCGK